MMKNSTPATLKGLLAAALFVLPPDQFARQGGWFISHYLARGTAR